MLCGEHEHCERSGWQYSAVTRHSWTCQSTLSLTAHLIWSNASAWVWEIFKWTIPPLPLLWLSDCVLKLLSCLLTPCFPLPVSCLSRPLLPHLARCHLTANMWQQNKEATCGSHPPAAILLLIQGYYRQLANTIPNYWEWVFSNKIYQTVIFLMAEQRLLENIYFSKFVFDCFRNISHLSGV